MRDRNRKKSELRSVLFYLSVTVLGILLIGLSILFLARVNRRGYSYTVEPNTLLRMLNRGDYAESWRDVQDNRAIGETEQKDKAYALPYAVVDYFEAASYYSVYQDSGDAGQAARYKEDMEQAYEAMGELQFMAEEIDEMFTQKEVTE